MDRIILAFASEKAHAQITRILGSGGLAPSISCFSGAETIRAARKLGGAVVICGFRLRDMTAEMLAVDLTGIAPVLVISSPGNLELCGDRNLIKLAGRSSSPRWIWPRESLQAAPRLPGFISSEVPRRSG